MKSHMLVVMMMAVSSPSPCWAQAATAPVSMPAKADLAQSQRIVDPACFCWANGERYNRGESVCLRTNNGRKLALCDQVTNVMSWAFSENPCPES